MKYLIASVFLLLVACENEVKLPPGFASFNSDKEILAYHPNGIVLKSKKIVNHQKASIAFWREAVLTQLSNKGYELVEEKGIQQNKRSELVFLTTYEMKPFLYQVVLIEKGNDIQLIEVGGPTEEMSKSSKEIESYILANDQG